MKDKGKERRKNSPEKKKERWKSENGSMLKELGTLCVRGWVAAFPAVFAVFPNYTSLAEPVCVSVCVFVHLYKKVPTVL